MLLIAGPIFGSHVFTPKLAYTQIEGTLDAHPILKWLWKSCGRSRQKFFCWLLFCDRLNTREILRRKRRTLDNFCCVLCTQQQEKTMAHLSLIVLSANGAGTF
jgi:hypothetical protein